MARGSSPVHGSRASSSRCIGAGKPFVKLTFAGSPMRCALGGDGLKKASVKDRELPHGSAYSDKGSIHWKCTGQITWLLLVQTTLSNKTSQNWVRFVIGMERLRHLRRLHDYFGCKPFCQTACYWDGKIETTLSNKTSQNWVLFVIGMERLRQKWKSNLCRESVSTLVCSHAKPSEARCVDRPTLDKQIIAKVLHVGDITL